jgi:DNA-binding CsgD family transcriptional regulator
MHVIFNPKGTLLGMFATGHRLNRYSNILNLTEELRSLQDPEHRFLPKKVLTNYPGLSKRQSQCLFHLLSGKSASAIGKKLNLSTRTIEAYLDDIKTKLNCHCKTDIFEKANTLGFMHILPLLDQR